MGLGDSVGGSDCGIGSIYHGVCRPQDFQYSSPRHDASILWSGPSSREFFQFISATNRLIGEVVQSRRRPLLGSSTG